jgi:hypothetical protein
MKDGRGVSLVCVYVFVMIMNSKFNASWMRENAKATILGTPAKQETSLKPDLAFLLSERGAPRDSLNQGRRHTPSID